MSERPRFNIHEAANDFVNRIEDQWVSQQFETVNQMKRRAEGSKTLNAQKEYESADNSLSREIARLTPPSIHNSLDDCDDINEEESGR